MQSRIATRRAGAGADQQGLFISCQQRGQQHALAASPERPPFWSFSPLAAVSHGPYSGRIVLPRNDRLQGQIVGLERRTSAVGRDTISHPDRGHDDVANADAGAAALSKRGGYDKSMRWVSGDNDREDPRSNRNLKVLDKPGSEPRVGKSYWRERKPESS
jgi:hypothetical protein